MSSAIKPPGAPGTSGPAASEAGAAGDVSSSEKGDAFRAELSRTGGPGSADTARGADGTSTDAPSTVRTELLRALAEELRSGRVDPKQAVDRLIERALHTGPAASLPPARRAELEALLRAALEEDPTLAAMQRDLSRGR